MNIDQVVDAVLQRIDHLSRAWSTIQRIENLPQARTAGIVFPAFAGMPPSIVAADDLIAKWDRHVPDTIGLRINYLKPYRKEIQPSLRYKATQNNSAFTATASSLALVHPHTSAQTA